LGRRLQQSLKDRAQAMVAESPTREPNGALTIERVLLDWGVRQVDRHVSTALFEALNVPIHLSRVLFDDVISTLSVLQARRFKLGVVTNRLWGGPSFVKGMEAMGLLSYFDPLKMAVSADLGIRKPAPEIFLHALRAYKVAPGEAAMIGNSLATDVVGAQQTGILAIWKPEPQILGVVKAHLARGHLSVRQYNAGHRLPQYADHNQSAAAGLEGLGTLPPDLLERPHIWQPFLRGSITPDLLIGHLKELPDLFDPPHAPRTRPT
jgi:FMN phosphatase YigB (HAD superfamily)